MSKLALPGVMLKYERRHGSLLKHGTGRNGMERRFKVLKHGTMARDKILKHGTLTKEKLLKHGTLCVVTYLTKTHCSVFCSVVKKTEQW